MLKHSHHAPRAACQFKSIADGARRRPPTFAYISPGDDETGGDGRRGHAGAVRFWARVVVEGRHRIPDLGYPILEAGRVDDLGGKVARVDQLAGGVFA